MWFDLHMHWLLLPLAFVLLGQTQNQQWPQSVTGSPACALAVTSAGQTTNLGPGSVADPGKPIVIDPSGRTYWQLSGPTENDDQSRSSDLVWRFYLFDVPVSAEQARATSFFGSIRGIDVMPFRMVGLGRLVVNVQSSGGECSFNTWVQVAGDPTGTPFWFIGIGFIIVALMGIFYSLPVRYRAVEAEIK